GALGRVGLPRATDDRRARAPPAREARTRPERAGVHPHRARGRLPLPGTVNPFRSVGARLRLALVIVVTLALLLVYLAVVPSLRSRLVGAKLSRMQNAIPGIVAGTATFQGIPTPQKEQAGFDWVDNLATWSEWADGARVSVYSIVLPARGTRHTVLSSYR